VLYSEQVAVSDLPVYLDLATRRLLWLHYSKHRLTSVGVNLMSIAGPLVIKSGL